MADGFSIRVYPNDHGPPHVHAWKGGGWVALTIPTAGGAVSVLRVSGMKHTDIVRVALLVEEHAHTLWQAWRRYHGEETV